jgi:hypothetical protein
MRRRTVNGWSVRALTNPYRRQRVSAPPAGAEPPTSVSTSVSISPPEAPNHPYLRAIVGTDTRSHNPRVGVRVPPPASPRTPLRRGFRASEHERIRRRSVRGANRVWATSDALATALTTPTAWEVRDGRSTGDGPPRATGAVRAGSVHTGTRRSTAPRVTVAELDATPRRRPAGRASLAVATSRHRD